MSDVSVLMDGLVFGEQPRWHMDRLRFSDWGTQQVIAVDMDGNSEVVLTGRSFPLCVDWLPDGRLLVVSAREGLLLRQEPDGSLQTHGDLGRVSDPPAGNELVVDGRGTAYVNGGGFDLMAGEDLSPGIIAVVAPDGSAREVADGLAFPNGMLIMPDDRTLIVAESYAKRLTAFDIATDGSLTNPGSGPSSAMGYRTASVRTRTTPSGTRTCRTSGACACAKAARSCKRSNSTADASPVPSAARTGRPCS
jgi:sugar lactone lactonase YvrE